MLRKLLIIAVAALFGYLAALVHVAVGLAENPRQYAEIAVEGEPNLDVRYLPEETDVPRGE
ncbi:hypothetical protein PN419_00165 [Halorubrum ezzemoulense]|uniref:hypothetical protein n=1 Tax=Halorubrum ezzemoulense TaxID=337243 RepID=UPI002330A01C|nr:hypothetical protein [Halorubrum ezzemoulense]MDB9247421.1 hypothetical protein [Halorubrum ezzemoulense]MDB9258670.1 hypothetical protein [Halorubrum ezzemoulense]MDB9264472.1 hypothetical protein [Halorubrum ezzemoulense]MDB9269031.1 hypothetical protein [Halorubrum ezzemoulense]MDB9271440.1 hypothetical protein [Halorubrum ezzemoulense]